MYRIYILREIFSSVNACVKATLKKNYEKTAYSIVRSKPNDGINNSIGGDLRTIQHDLVNVNQIFLLGQSWNLRLIKPQFTDIVNLVSFEVACGRNFGRKNNLKFKYIPTE